MLKHTYEAPIFPLLDAARTKLDSLCTDTLGSLGVKGVVMNAIESKLLEPRSPEPAGCAMGTNILETPESTIFGIGGQPWLSQECLIASQVTTGTI